MTALRVLLASLLLGLFPMPRAGAAESGDAADPPAASAEAPDPEPADPEHAAIENTLDLVQELVEDGEYEAARASLEWVLWHSLTEDQRVRAQALVGRLPERSVGLGPRVRLATWQSLYGAYLLGPNVSGMVGGHEDAWMLYAGSLAGIGLGTATAFLTPRWWTPGPAQTTTILAAQKLGSFNGAALGVALASEDSDTHVFWGIFAGGVAGTAAGYALAARDPDPGRAAGVHSGAFWGLGLGLTVLSASYALDEGEAPVYWLQGFTDLGAGVGWLLSGPAGLDQAAWRALDAGGMLGAGAGFLFVVVLQDVIWFTPAAVSWTVGGAGALGGAVGLLAHRYAGSVREARPGGLALVGGTWGDLHLGTPMPRPRLQPGSSGWELDLVRVAF